MQIRKIVILATVLFSGLWAFGQEVSSPYQFTTEVDNDATEIKDQCRTGTCWSFATQSFVESEIMRMGKGAHNVSEMYNVRMTYPKKADMYMRYHGNYQFSPGSLSHDVMNVIEEYGMVPESVYSGLQDGSEIHDHGELDRVLEAMMKSYTNEGRSRPSAHWRDAVDAVLDVYLGEIPETFEYDGKEYTPQQFRDAMGIIPDNYVSLSSFSHHDYYEPFILEVPDNFSQGSFYNLPLEEFEQVAEHALRNGYTIAWDADVSERGFSFQNGMAILPANGTSKEEMFSTIIKEMDVDQEVRQAAFDDFSTTDDHLMHITGLAKDQNGSTYFMLKNSWGTGNLYGGKQYISQSYFEMKSISIMVHKDALPKDIRKKLGL